MGVTSYLLTGMILQVGIFPRNENGANREHRLQQKPLQKRRCIVTGQIIATYVRRLGHPKWWSSKVVSRWPTRPWISCAVRQSPQNPRYSNLPRLTVDPLRSCEFFQMRGREDYRLRTSEKGESLLQRDFSGVSHRIHDVWYIYLHLPWILWVWIFWFFL